MTTTTHKNGAAPAPQNEKDSSKNLALQQAGNVGMVLSSQALRKQLATILPTHLDPDRFVRIALLAASKTPKLKQCTQESLLSCLIDLTQLGLEPDGRKAHLIPYGTVCTLVIDYKGLMELARRSGEVRDIQCDVVYEKEFESGRFVFERGSNAQLVHKPLLVGDRGPVIGAYSFVKMRDGIESQHWMRLDEIEAIRKRSKAANNGPWVSDYNEMAKKTVFRQHSKTLPFSSSLQEKIEKDDHYLYDFSASTGDNQPPAGRQKLRNQPQQTAPTDEGDNSDGRTFDSPVDNGELTEAEKQQILEEERRAAAAG